MPVIAAVVLVVVLGQSFAWNQTEGSTTNVKPAGIFKSGDKLAVIHQAGNGEILDCEIFGDRVTSQQMMEKFPGISPQVLTSEEFRELVRSCHQAMRNENSEYRKTVQYMKARKDGGKGLAKSTRKGLGNWDWLTIFRGIFPGTLWCGLGNIASNFDDLSDRLRKLDMCCRAHDHCTPVWGSMGCYDGFCNFGFYSALECECDQAFRECLQAVDQEEAKDVMYVFFDFLDTDCVKKQYPKHCTRWCSYFWGAVTYCCEEGDDTSQPKQWAWFDQPGC